MGFDNVVATGASILDALPLHVPNVPIQPKTLHAHLAIPHAPTLLRLLHNLGTS